MTKKKFKPHQYHVYIMASINKVIYIGVTDNLIRRVWEHKRDLVEGFSKKYKCHTLVYAEYYQWIQEAIRREKQLKKWRREKKVTLIEEQNSHWRDLSLE